MPDETPDLLENSLQLHDELRARLKTFYDCAAAAGITEIHVTFAGGGDEGQMESIDLTLPEGAALPADLEDPMELAEAVAEAHGGDYYNNDGGHGTVRLLVAERRVAVDMSHYVMETVSDDKEAAL